MHQVKKQYVGSTEGDLQHANAHHRLDIEQQRTLLGRHFASVCGYDNWSLAIIDKCSLHELSRRHKFWEQELVTRFPVGLNDLLVLSKDLPNCYQYIYKLNA